MSATRWWLLAAAATNAALVHLTPASPSAIPASPPRASAGPASSLAFACITPHTPEFTDRPKPRSRSSMAIPSRPRPGFCIRVIDLVLLTSMSVDTMGRG